jgi:hypothetical protein
MQTVLASPQLPVPRPTPPPKDWKGIGHGFGVLDQFLRTLVQYLQSYLGSIRSQIIPASFILATATGAAYSVGASEGFIAAASSAGADIAVNLPQAAGSGRALVIVKTDANAHNVVVTASGSDTINGAATVNLSSQYQALRIVDAAAGEWLEW